jgi:surface carbohydrate biosynthesis protein
MIEKKKTIIFTIELADRELLGKCLLALEMAKNGFRVYIGTFRAVHEIRHNIKSCIFFHKSSYKRRALQYKKQMGAKVAIMDEEAGIAIPSHRMEDFVRFRFGSLTSQAYDYVFTIGERYARMASQLPNMQGINVISSGWPRVDLWREEFSSIHNKKVSEIKQEHGSYWLFVSSFGFTSEAGFERRLAKAYSEQAARSAKNVYQALKNYIDLIKKLASDQSQKIIVRPHTSESTHDWQDIFSEHPNIRVIREGDITPWLLAADGVITYRSTVNVQAALNGIPTVQYKINEIDGINDLAVFKVSKCSETVEEVRNHLNSFKSGSQKETLKKLAIEALEDNVTSLDGKTASQKIAEVLLTANISPQPEIRITPLKRALSHCWDRYKYLEYKTTKLLLKNSKKRRMSRFEKIPNGIQATEISSIIEKLKISTGAKDLHTRIHQASTNLVLIEAVLDEQA